MLNKNLLALLVCPVSHTQLHYLETTQELASTASGLAYPIRNSVPVMLESEARPLSAEEKLSLAKA